MSTIMQGVRRRWYRFQMWAEYNPVVRWCERVIYCHHNARVIADFEYRMACVLDAATGTMSKPYYFKEDMLAEIGEAQQRAYDLAHSEGEEDGRAQGGYICQGGLTLDAMRTANLARQAEWPNPECDSWTLGDWGLACLSEFGEAGNIVKKVLRGDFPLEQARPDIAKEFADGLTYLDVWASRLGIDLGAAYVAKWNEVAAKRGLKIRLVIEEEFVVDADDQPLPETLGYIPLPDTEENRRAEHMADVAHASGYLASDAH